MCGCDCSKELVRHCVCEYCIVFLFVYNFCLILLKNIKMSKAKFTDWSQISSLDLLCFHLKNLHILIYLPLLYLITFQCESHFTCKLIFQNIIKYHFPSEYLTVMTN